AMKAGLMEVSDVFVINKSDRPGADRMARDVSMMLHLRMGQTLRNVPAHHGVDLERAARTTAPTPPAGSAPETAEWEIPVLRTTAHEGAGIGEVAGALDRHRAWLDESGKRAERRRARLALRVRDEVDRRLRELAWREGPATGELEAALPLLESGATTPYEVARRIVDAVLGARRDSRPVAERPIHQ
ncbi:MAG: hypothetical protein L0271_17295, partial [Gemmatimonadetes bacterium]|nr:hypothetical protein [Gemmatimonadota bacterium]